jgi:hypothetical protein
MQVMPMLALRRQGEITLVHESSLTNELALVSLRICFSSSSSKS